MVNVDLFPTWPVCGDVEKTQSDFREVFPNTSPAPGTPASRIQVLGRQLLVNGAPLHLKGVAWNPVPKGGRHPADLDFASFVERLGRDVEGWRGFVLFEGERERGWGFTGGKHDWSYSW